MNINKLLSFTLIGAVSLTNAEFAVADDLWSVRGYLGYSQTSDQSATVSEFEAGANSLTAQIDTGFTSGFGVAYQLSPAWAAELAWDYRSNDSEVSLNNGSVFKEGNYASNIFHFNGIYSLPTNGNWQPYVGAGLSWVQEIDIDLEEGGTERSFSDSGEIGYQVFAGVNKSIADKWLLQSELRFGSFSDLTLTEEDGSGQLTGLDYQPITFQVGLVYQF